MKATLSESTRVKVAVYKPKINLIQRVIGEHFNLTLHEMQSHGRRGSSIQARRYICYFAKEFTTNCPLAVIGLLIGNGKAFDHASIHHSYNKLVSEMTMTNRSGNLVYPEIQEEVRLLRGKIKRALSLAGEYKEVLYNFRFRRIRYHYRGMFHRSLKIYKKDINNA